MCNLANKYDRNKFGTNLFVCCLLNELPIVRLLKNAIIHFIPNFNKFWPCSDDSKTGLFNHAHQLARIQAAVGGKNHGYVLDVQSRPIKNARLTLHNTLVDVTNSIDFLGELRLAALAITMDIGKLSPFKKQ